MLKVRIARCLMFVLVSIVMSGCQTTSVITTQKADGIFETTYTGRDGYQRKKETFYRTDDGKKVLHGESYRWRKSSGIGELWIYQNGKLIEKKDVIISG